MTQSRSPKRSSYNNRGPKRVKSRRPQKDGVTNIEVPKIGKSRRPQKDGVTNIEVPKGDKKSTSQVRLRSGDGAPQGWRNMCATWRNRVGSWKWRFGGERVAKPGAAFSVSFRATFRGVPPFLTLSSFLSLSPASVSAFSLSLLCPITPKNPRACAHLDCVLTSGTHPSFRPFF
jgi:hypothetical protein